MRIQETEMTMEKTYFQSAAARDKVQDVQSGQEGSTKDVVRRKDQNGDTGGQSRGQAETHTEKKLDRAALEETLDKMNEELKAKNIELKFRVHEESGETQIEVKDPTSDKVIRKIPSDDLLKVSANIKEFAGAFLDKPV